MYVYDRSHRPLELGGALFEGGEGVIWTVSGLPGSLAKLYRPGKRTSKETKLAWMAANPPADPGKAGGQAALAWPETLLYESDGCFAGYMMPHIPNATTLLHVLNPRLRTRTLPAFDWRYLHRAARNLAGALRAVHAQDYVIGDLNETNVLVAPSALVTLIDADSFQVKEKHTGQITFYPCPVGRPEYTPPELQGCHFLNEVRRPEQDNFALAVLIFQLLMDGNHPFRSTWLGQGDPPPLEEKIIKGWFPYASEPRSLVKPPSGISLDRLYPPLVALMQRCFVDGHKNPLRRPTAAEWERALTDAERALTTCACGTIHSVHLERCPHCGLPSPKLIITCPKCGKSNPDPYAYCKRCAAHLHPLAECPHCGQLTVQALRAKFCEACGRQL